ncbi:RICIN domain-containing protein [Streptomyces sp. NPDC018693]|uniref:RICIN domain-containing protein n=1 Tax=unclassified Streptomyces TaxID=2593676 RepID=UPI0037A12493
MKAPKRVLAAGLCTLTASGTMLAALIAAPAANANSATTATASARAPFTTKLMVNHSGKCLDVKDASTADLASVQQWTCYNAPGNQTFIFTAVGDSLNDGYYTIRASHSGKCLDVTQGSQANGARVYQWHCNGQPNQEWKLVQRPNGYFSLVARHSGKCMEVAGGSLANGAVVVQQTCASDRPWQEWKLL